MVKFVKGFWRIDSPVLQPHVSAAALRAFIVGEFQKEPERQRILIQKLDALSKSTP